MSTLTPEQPDVLSAVIRFDNSLLVS